MKLVRYGLVGALNTAVTLGAIFLTSKLWGWNFALANLAGYALGILNSYFWNRRWTFHAGTSLGSLLPFLAVTGLCYLIQASILFGLTLGLGVGTDLAQVISVVVSALTGFALNRTLVFKEVAVHVSQRHHPVP